jgi:ABC-type transporter Mla maintaining outer membrane lipid asymmetry ATPase subunit MlaF
VDDAARARVQPVVEEDAEVLIECRDVYKSFGEKHILRGASFKVSLLNPDDFSYAVSFFSLGVDNLCINSIR